MHAAKVTIFKVLLLQNGEDWGIQTFRNESQDHDLALGCEREGFTTVHGLGSFCVSRSQQLTYGQIGDPGLLN